MVELQGYKFYRTENLTISNVLYTVRFSLSNDGVEFVLFVSNNSNGKQSKYHFNKEVADDFKHYQGEKLENEILSIIQNDVQNNII